MDRSLTGPARIALVLSLLAAILLPPPAAAAGADGPAIVFNEVAAASSRSNADSFFELKNVSDEAIDLTGWSVYRCSVNGLRKNRGLTEADLSGIVVAPGGIVTVTRVGTPLAPGGEADAHFSGQYAARGFGLYLESPDGALADAISVYPSAPTPMPTECSARGNLPNILAAALDESWQRVSHTGDVRRDFVRARSSVGLPNEPAAAASGTPAIVIDEIAAAGPAGSADDLVELHNTSRAGVDIGGWRLYRCTAAGRLTADTLRTVFAPGTRIPADGRLVIGGPGYTARSGEPAPDITVATSLADTVSGVLLTTAAGERVAGVTVSNHEDTACQTGDEKLASELDYRTGESWQRHPATGEYLIAPRTPGIAGPTSAPAAERVEVLSDVAISEFAVDPEIADAPGGYRRHHFVELANYGDRAVDIGGWRLIGCQVDGFRAVDDLTVVPSGTQLRPGGTWLAALQGTPVEADATFADPLDFLGAGVWLEDAAGNRVDSVGAYHANELDFSLERHSPCSNGLSLPTFAVDRLAGETYQRSQFTGVDADDFVSAMATPGARDLRPVRNLSRVTEAAVARHLPRPGAVTATADAGMPAPAGAPAVVISATAGVSGGGPLATRSGTGERPIDSGGVDGLRAETYGYDFPYVRMTIAVPGAEPRITWRGEGAHRNELRLSVWRPGDEVWRELAHATGRAVGDTLTLTGTLRADEVTDGAAEILVQSVPRTTPTLSNEPDGVFADPADYDFAISHLTDTQYLTEAYPQVYAEAVGWILANRETRKIAFTTHTGDLIQNWVDPDQTEPRARREYEIASDIQAVLDRAGMPNSVLPGNHDNKRGITADLFNEYFGPGRYADAHWYDGSLTEHDNSANYSTFERAGAKFLMLSLPYAFGERELVWAEAVVARHPDHNIVVSTHEHVTPADDDSRVRRSTSSRWVSRGDQLWHRVIAPNRNVVAVLSGHFHGVGRIVTENAGGIEGHTVVEMVADYQEFRTGTGERSTGFQRLLQIDLAGGRLTADTFSATLDSRASAPYDYVQFVPENGDEGSATNARPWNILTAGLQERYTAADDEFAVPLAFQHHKAVRAAAVSAGPAG